MAENAATEPSVAVVDSVAAVEERSSQAVQELTEPADVITAVTDGQAEDMGGDNSEAPEAAAESDGIAVPESSAMAESSGEARDEDDNGEEDTGEDEPQLVEADDEMPQREETTEGGGEKVEDDTTTEQPLTEADREIERYNELVRQAGEQLTLEETGEDEHQHCEQDTAHSAATDLLATTALSSPASTLYSDAADTNTTIMSISQPPIQITAPLLSAGDDIPSPLSPSSPSASSPAFRSWSDVEVAKAECEHLLHINKTRQRHIALILDAERRQNHPSLAVAAAAAQQSQSVEGGANEPIKTDYIKLLTQLSAIWDEVNEQQSRSETAIARLLDKLNEQDRVGEEMQDSLRAFIIEMARTATDKRGNIVHISKYERLLVDEAKVNRQLADVRLLYLQQQGQMDVIQHDIKAKEELAEGLHLIDFEQLKIENATLHEKIEERNDEIYKLTKKKHACIEVLTHVREKVWFVWRDNQLLHDRVSEMDDAILEKRQRLKKLKQQREALRRQNELLKTKEGFVGVDALVMDFEKRKELLSALRERIEVKRSRWEKITRAKERRASAAAGERSRQRQTESSEVEEASESKEQTHLWAQTRAAHVGRLSR